MKEAAGGVLTLENGDDQGTDYILDEEATSCWITVDNISVYIIRTDEGVIVDLYPLSQESGDCLASTYAFNEEGRL